MSPTEREVVVDAAFLRCWRLPDPGDSKHTRGEVLVIGGAARSPGAAVLAGRAALRVGAGRLTIGVGATSATATAVSFPECGIVALPETPDGAIRGRGIGAAAGDVSAADAVLVGPGLDDIGETTRLLRRLRPLLDKRTVLILDAFALGALAGAKRKGRRGPLVLTPNLEEAALLLGRRLRDTGEDVVAIARRYGAVVTCYGWVAHPRGPLLYVAGAGPGLGTSGSGDALAGAITGLAARGCSPLQAAVWGTYLHTAAGNSLARDIAPLGFLAGEIVDRFPHELAAVERSAGGNDSITPHG